MLRKESPKTTRIIKTTKRKKKGLSGIIEAIPPVPRSKGVRDKVAKAILPGIVVHKHLRLLRNVVRVAAVAIVIREEMRLRGIGLSARETKEAEKVRENL